MTLTIRNSTPVARKCVATRATARNEAPKAILFGTAAAAILMTSGTAIAAADRNDTDKLCAQMPTSSYCNKYNPKFGAYDSSTEFKEQDTRKSVDLLPTPNVNIPNPLDAMKK